ncbi:unnamed protein product [Pleuronectes platessa]|uniref:Uncharacterized protein n=1 Tax=Pleuronectes platessa TaxID=8262 RepID=A0A9N7ZD55_PLEPL|nr:unnamed protein product [Pleuronectes platessa]
MVGGRSRLLPINNPPTPPPIKTAGTGEDAVCAPSINRDHPPHHHHHHHHPSPGASLPVPWSTESGDEGASLRPVHSIRASRGVGGCRFDPPSQPGQQPQPQPRPLPVSAQGETARQMRQAARSARGATSGSFIGTSLFGRYDSSDGQEAAARAPGEEGPLGGSQEGTTGSEEEEEQEEEEQEEEEEEEAWHRKTNN